MLENINIQKFYDLTLGCIGGGVATIYVIRKYGTSAFSSSLLISNISLGAFVGYLVGGVVPAEWYMHDIIVSFSGITAYSIVDIGETQFAKYVYERLFNFGDTQNPEVDSIHTEHVPQSHVRIKNDDESIIIMDRRRVDLPIIGDDRRTREPEYID